MESAAAAFLSKEGGEPDNKSGNIVVKMEAAEKAVVAEQKVEEIKKAVADVNEQKVPDIKSAAAAGIVPNDQKPIPENATVRKADVQDAVKNPEKPAPPSYIIVCGSEGGSAVELPLDKDNSLPLSTLQIEYTGAGGIKFRNPSTGIYRVIAPENDRILPPPAGWGDHHYVACIVKSPETWSGTEKRSISPPTPSVFGNPPLKQSRVEGYFMPEYPPAIAAASKNYSPRGNVRGGNRRGSSEPKVPKPIEFEFCEVCKVSLNSQVQATMHYDGAKHKAAAAGMTYQKNRGGGRGGRFPTRGTRGGPRGNRGNRGGGYSGGFQQIGQTAKQMFDYTDDVPFHSPYPAPSQAISSNAIPFGRGAPTGQSSGMWPTMF